MSTAAGRMSFHRELATALVTAAASSPAVVGATLAATTLLVDDVVWSAGASLIAGVVLRRSHAVAPSVAAGLLIALWFSVTSWNDRSPLQLSHVSWTPLPTAIATAALLVGLTGPRAAAIPFVVVAATSALVLLPHHFRWTRRSSDVVWVVGALAIALLARRRTRLFWIVTVVVVATAAGAAAGWKFDRLPKVDRVLSALALLLVVAPFLGEVAAELDQGAEGDDGARLVVLVQRRPFLAGMTIAAATVLFARSWIAACGWHIAAHLAPARNRFSPYEPGPASPWSPLVALQAGFSLLAYYGGRGVALGPRLAPWLAANFAALGMAYVLVDASLTWPQALAVATPLAFWPLLVGAYAERVSSSVLVAAGGLIGLAGIALLDHAAPHMSLREILAGMCVVLCISLAPVAFHGVVRCRLSARAILAAALVLALAASSLLRAASFHGFNLDPSLSALATTFVAAGLLAVAARRCRSMTAVPLDHPVVADFGGWNSAPAEQPATSSPR